MKNSLKALIGVVAVGLSAGGTCLYANSRTYAADSEKSESETKTDTSVTEKEIKTSDGSVSKKEVIYVLADAQGNETKTIVSGHLKNPSALDLITDTEMLTDITNVKGYEEFTANGSEVTWNAGGNDIYFRGETNEAVPVSLKVRYFLDGNELSPSEIKGKNGKITIRFEYTNNTSSNIEIDGESRDVVTPFIMVTGLILDNSRFANIQATNGKVMSDGNKTIVVGYGLPGIRNSLELSDSFNIDIPEYFEFTADTVDFSLDDTVTVASSNIFGNTEIDKKIDLSRLTESLSELSEASEALVDGSSVLYDGTAELYSAGRQIGDGINALSVGAEKLNTASSELSGGAEQLKDGTSQLSAGADALKAGAEQLSAGASQLSDGAEAIKTGLGSEAAGIAAISDGVDTAAASLNETIAGNEQILQGLNAYYAATGSEDIKLLADSLGTTVAYQKQISASMSEGGDLKNGLTQLAAGNTALSSGAETLCGGINSLSEGISGIETGAVSLSAGIGQVNTGAGSLSDGITAYTAGVGSLYEGTETLSVGWNEFYGGIEKVKNGAGELSDGIKKFDEEGIKMLGEKLDDEINNLMHNLDAILEASRNYKAFSGNADGIDGDSTFIIKTCGE